MLKIHPKPYDYFFPNPYGEFHMPDNTLGEIAHNGIGLPTKDQRSPVNPADPYFELASIVRRSMKNDGTDPTRPHCITMHMSGSDLIRFVQLAMLP